MYQQLYKYNNNIKQYEKELQEAKQMKIEFIHKHEYDDKAGQWRVKETKATNKSDKSGFTDKALVVLSKIF